MFAYNNSEAFRTVILGTANCKRKMTIKLRTRQTRFTGHTMRMKKLEHLVIAEQTEGKDQEDASEYI